MVKSKVGILVAFVLPITSTGFSCPAAAQVTQDKSGGYLFRVKYIKGMKLTYEMKTSASVGGLSPQQAQLFDGSNHFDVTATTVSEVLDVKNGIATIRNTTTTRDNRKPNKSALHTDTYREDIMGRRVGLSHGSFDLIDLPSRPLNIGESFNSSIHDLAMGSQNKDTPSDCKFLGIKTIGDRKVAQFNLNLRLTSKDGKASGTGVGYLLIDTADGQLYSLHYKMNAKGDFANEKRASNNDQVTHLTWNSDMTITRKQ